MIFFKHYQANNTKQYLLILSLSLFLSFQSLSAKESSLSGVIAAHVKQSLDDHKDMKKIKTILDDSLKNDPESSALKYQLARYILKTGFNIDNSIIAYHYKPEAEKLASDILKKIIKLEPSNGEAYTLLGHIYMVQNKQKEAQKYFSKAVQIKQAIPWLAYNQALLEVRKENFTKAAAQLNKIAKKRPSNNKNGAQNKYRSAWRILKKIALEKPKYDPNKLVRSGLTKRISAEEIAKYTDNKKTNKLMFVHFTSNDPWCKACIKSNKNVASFAKKFQPNVDFIHVSFEPWRSVSNHKKLLKKYSLMALPTGIFFYKGEKLSTHPGLTTQKNLEKFLKKNMKKIKTGK